MDLSLYEVDQAIRIGHVQMYGDSVGLPEGWDRPLISHTNAMAAWIGEAWRAGAKLDAMVLGGGGAELEMVADRIRRLLRHLQVVERRRSLWPLAARGMRGHWPRRFPPSSQEASY